MPRLQSSIGVFIGPRQDPMAGLSKSATCTRRYRRIPATTFWPGRRHISCSAIITECLSLVLTSRAVRCEINDNTVVSQCFDSETILVRPETPPAALLGSQHQAEASRSLPLPCHPSVGARCRTLGSPLCTGGQNGKHIFLHVLRLSPNRWCKTAIA